MISFHTCPLAALGGKQTGGMNVYVREVARQLGSRNIHVDVFTRSQNPRLDTVVHLGDGARVIHIPAGPEVPYGNRQGWLYLPEFTRGIRDFARTQRVRYDLIHSHYWLSGWTGIPLCRDMGIPLIHMFHTLGVMKNRVARDKRERETGLRIFLEKRIMDCSQLIVASSPADKAHMVCHYGAAPHKIEVIPCGVDLNLFRPLPKTAAKRQLDLSSRRILLFVGRIQPIKGLDCLFNALALLIERSKVSADDLRLLIIGGDLDNGENVDDGEVKKLKHLTVRLGLDSMVTFLGAQPQHRLPYFYSAAETCVLPSRYESFGMVVLESMACGTPVIASRVGGLGYTVRDGQTGYLIPEGDAEALADRVDRLLQDNRLRDRMGCQSTLHAKMYSWENVTLQIIRLYNQILSREIPVNPHRDAAATHARKRELRNCSGSP